MNETMFSLIQKPAYQAALFLLITPLVIFLVRPRTTDIAWTIAACCFALFLIANAAFLWSAESPWKYFFYSIGCAIAYILLVAALMPVILKILKLEGSGESGMAFLILIYQPFALLLVMLVKWIAVKWF